MMNTRHLARVALAALVLAGCSSSDGSSGDDETPAGDLRPADEVEAEARDDAALGEPIELGDGGYLTITDPTVEDDDGGPVVVIQVRGEARGDAPAYMPEVSVSCNGDTEDGGWVADSTFPMYDEIPAGSFDEGTLVLLPPGNHRTGEPVPTCDQPGALVISRTDGEGVQVPLDAALVDQYNALVDDYNAAL